MNKDEKINKEFEELCRPLIEWLCKNRSPHCFITVTPIGAELASGELSTGEIFDYVKF